MDAVTSLRGRRVMVTGTTGFLGGRFAEWGDRHGIHVIRMQRRATGPPDDRTVFADMLDLSSLRAAVERAQPEGVLHLAAAGVSAGPPTAADLLEANGVGTANLLDALRPAGPIPFVMAGTGFEYRMCNRLLSETDPLEPPSAYGVSKVAATLCAGAHAAYRPVTVLRLFNVYGVGEPLPRLIPTIIDAARRRRPVDLTECTQIRDFVYVEDVARLFWLALAESPPIGSLRILNVSSGRPARLRHYVDLLARTLREQGLEPELRFGARTTREGDPSILAGDITRLTRTFAWSATTSFEEGIRRTVEGWP